MDHESSIKSQSKSGNNFVNNSQLILTLTLNYGVAIQIFGLCKMKTNKMELCARNKLEKLKH